MTSASRYDGRDSRVSMYSSPALPWPSVQALPALAALDRALAATGPTPCMVVEPQAWLSDDPEDREIAAMYCAGCPVLTECTAAGEKEHFGVWGGKDRTRKHRQQPEESNTMQEDREFARRLFAPADDGEAPPRDVVDGEPGPGVTREFVQRYSDAFGMGRGRAVLRPGAVVENADGEPIAVTPNEQVPTLLAGMTITPADVRRLGYTPAELAALPGIYVADGVQFFPAPGTRWSLKTRQIEEIAS